MCDHVKATREYERRRGKRSVVIQRHCALFFASAPHRRHGSEVLRACCWLHNLHFSPWMELCQKSTHYRSSAGRICDVASMVSLTSVNESKPSFLLELPLREDRSFRAASLRSRPRILASCFISATWTIDFCDSIHRKQYQDDEVAQRM